MGLILKANSGPLDGQTFPLNGEIIIGRQNADINLSDPKVSSAHARIVKTDGGFEVLDNGSKNGLRDAAGERIESLELKRGAIFAIGDTTFEVLESPKAARAEAVQPLAEAVVPKVKKPPRYWHDVLAEFMEKRLDKFEDKPTSMRPLDPALILEFVRGVQVNSKWILGFGPRRIGAASLDLPIWEPNAPAVCFEISPSPEGLVFSTEHPALVQLNGREIDKEVLRMGDTIKIMETLIEVDFAE